MWKDQQNNGNDHKIMSKDEEIAIDEAISVQRKRQSHLLDDALHADEGAAAFSYQSGDKHPENQTDGQHRQVILQLGMEQLCVNQPHSPDHHSGRQGLPEGAEDRAAITKPYILLREGRPQPALANAFDEIGYGEGGPR